MSFSSPFDRFSRPVRGPTLAAQSLASAAVQNLASAAVQNLAFAAVRILTSAAPAIASAAQNLASAAQNLASAAVHRLAPAAARVLVFAAPAFAAAASLVLVGAAPTAAQQTDEPVLEQVRDIFQTDGLTLGFLLQAVADPGLEEDPARFTVGNARIRLEGALDGGFSYKLQTNHVGTSTLLDAQVAWSPGPELTVAAGRFKTPFSRELLTYAGSIDFVNRSRVVSALAPNRQVGVQASGHLTEIVSWTIGGFTGSTNATVDESLIGVVRLEGAGVELGEGTLAVGASFAGGREDAIGARQLGPGFTGDGILYGADARFESGPLLLAGEYLRGEWERDFGVVDVESDGLYLTAGYMIQEARQILLRWDRFEAPAQDVDDILVFGFNAWPTDATELQVNWLVPLRDSNEIHKLLINFQVGI